MLSPNTITVLVAGLAVLAAAHPGHEEHVADRAVKRSFLEQSRRSLDSCAHHLERRGTTNKGDSRRRAMVEDLRRKEGLKIRDTDSVTNTSHHSSLTGVMGINDLSTFFTNQTCILSPEGEVGPFWVKGELNRDDIVDKEPGVVTYMHAQFIDVNTCEPIPDLWWDVWQANSTGVYSGVQDDSNGDGEDASNLNNTALRGIQKTDEDGIASFRSVFPGHYSGRATHVHIIGHTNATLLVNGTITGGSVAQIGQLFFDQDLISQVEATYPYNTSSVDITLNAVDKVLIAETEDSNSDPVFEYVLLGDDIEDGIFAWVTVGVDPTASYETSYAALYGAGGGVVNSQSGGGGGGNGTAPPDAPSGSSAPPASSDA